MTPESKIEFLAGQLNAAEMGLTTVIDCPYCETKTDFARKPMDFGYNEPPAICCDKFSDAMAAILLRKQMHESADLAHRALDKSNGLAVFN